MVSQEASNAASHGAWRVGRLTEGGPSRAVYTAIRRASKVSWHDPAEGAGAVAASDQAPRLAEANGPAAQSARVVVVGHPPIRSVLFVINFIFRCPRTLFRVILTTMNPN